MLVVDDDPDMLRVIRGLLEDEGIAVTTAADGGRAVALAEQRAPDLAVLDVQLPVLDGGQVATRLRALLGGRPFRRRQSPPTGTPPPRRANWVRTPVCASHSS